MPSKKVLEWIDKAMNAGVCFSLSHIEGGECCIVWEYLDVLLRDEATYWSMVLELPRDLIVAFMKYRRSMGMTDQFQCRHVKKRDGKRCKNEIFNGQVMLDEFCELYPTGLCRVHRSACGCASERV